MQILHTEEFSDRARKNNFVIHACTIAYRIKSIERERYIKLFCLSVNNFNYQYITTYSNLMDATYVCPVVIRIIYIDFPQNSTDSVTSYDHEQFIVIIYTKVQLNHKQPLCTWLLKLKGK